MKNSTVNLVKVLKDRLLEFPRIVNSLETKELSFMDNLLKWIKDVEDIFTTHNISDVSELSGLRSKILSPKFTDNRSTSIKKLQLKVASEILYDVQATVLNVLIPYERKVDDCRELTRQLLIIVSQTQTIKYNQNDVFEHFIDEIWQFILATEQLKAGAIKLKTSLSMTDIKLLIADELELEDFQ